MRFISDSEEDVPSKATESKHVAKKRKTTAKEKVHVYFIF